MPELRTQLEIAVQHQDIDAINHRFNQGDTANDKNHLGIPVFYDGLKTNNRAILTAFLQAGVDINIAYNHNGYTPFIYACLYCDKTTIQWLLNQGQNINQQTALGVSAIHVAVQRDNVTIAEYLVQQGANVFCKTHHGESPLLISLKSKTGLNTFKFLLQCYQDHQHSLADKLMPCLAYIFEKQQPDAIEAAQALLPFAESIPTEIDIRNHMAKPGNYSSSPLRTLENTLNSKLSAALFALLKAEKLSRQARDNHQTSGLSDNLWQDTGGL